MNSELQIKVVKIKMREVNKGIIDDKYNLCRADIFLSELADLTRSKAQEIIETGALFINGKAVKKNYKVLAGEHYEYEYIADDGYDIVAQDIPLDIVYEDEYLAVVNKPKGMVVHPAPGNKDNTMVNALLYKLSKLSSGGDAIRPGIVHRIDKNTSGLLIVAKDDKSHQALAKQIESHSFKREYRGIVIGTPKQNDGVIDAPIGRSIRDRKKMAVTDYNSKNAVTHYSVIESYGAYSFMKFNLETGRTHQIRVHMAYLGHSILGDDVYGGERKEFSELCGQCLHAFSIGFVHPVSNKEMYFESELPEYFINTLKKIENKYGGTNERL